MVLLFYLLFFFFFCYTLGVDLVEILDLLKNVHLLAIKMMMSLSNSNSVYSNVEGNVNIIYNSNIVIVICLL